MITSKDGKKADKLTKKKKIYPAAADAKDASPKDGIRQRFVVAKNKIVGPTRITRQQKQGMY